MNRTGSRSGLPAAPRGAWLASLGACLWLSACATNMATVSSFGVATQELSEQTTQVLSRYAGSCRERQDLVQWELGAMSSARGYWEADKRAERSLHLQHLDQQIAILRAASRSFDQECPQQEQVLGMVSRLSLVLSEYAKALQALASDRFVSWNGKLKLADAVGKLPAGSQSQALLSDAQMRAVDGLADLIYRMATLSYRQQRLGEALGEPAHADFLTLSDKLAALTTSYDQSIAFEILMLQGYSNDLSAALGAHDLPEPVAVSELRLRLDARVRELEHLRAALPAYRAALAAMDRAFVAAADSVRHPAGAAVAQGVSDFAGSAYDAEQALHKAFQGR